MPYYNEIRIAKAVTNMIGENMMRAKDYRQAAWEKLRGKWGTMAIATLIYALIMGACSALSLIYIGGIAALFLTGAFTLGLAIMGLAVARMQEVRAAQLFDGFKNYGSSLALFLLITIFTALWSLLLVIPGIIKAYSYSMSWYILADNPQMGANEARKQSMTYMNGNKWRLFCLHFSFIGWMLLGILTFGILYFWIIPYMQTAQAEFYRDIIAERSETNPNPPVATAAAV